MAYGARLESVLGASPRGFESPILRQHHRERETPSGLALSSFVPRRRRSPCWPTRLHPVRDERGGKGGQICRSARRSPMLAGRAARHGPRADEERSPWGTRRCRRRRPGRRRAYELVVRPRSSLVRSTALSIVFSAVPLVVALVWVALPLRLWALVATAVVVLAVVVGPGLRPAAVRVRRHRGRQRRGPRARHPGQGTSHAPTSTVWCSAPRSAARSTGRRASSSRSMPSGPGSSGCGPMSGATTRSTGSSRSSASRSRSCGDRCRRGTSLDGPCAGVATTDRALLRHRGRSSARRCPILRSGTPGSAHALDTHLTMRDGDITSSRVSPHPDLTSPAGSNQPGGSGAALMGPYSRPPPRRPVVVREHGGRSSGVPAYPTGTRPC